MCAVCVMSGRACVAIQLRQPTICRYSVESGFVSLSSVAISDDVHGAGVVVIFGLMLKRFTAKKQGGQNDHFALWSNWRVFLHAVFVWLGAIGYGVKCRARPALSVLFLARYFKNRHGHNGCFRQFRGTNRGAQPAPGTSVVPAAVRGAYFGPCNCAQILRGRPTQGRPMPTHIPGPAFHWHARLGRPGCPMDHMQHGMQSMRHAIGLN